MVVAGFHFAEPGNTRASSPGKVFTFGFRMHMTVNFQCSSQACLNSVRCVGPYSSD